MFLQHPHVWPSASQITLPYQMALDFVSSRNRITETKFRSTPLLIRMAK